MFFKHVSPPFHFHSRADGNLEEIFRGAFQIGIFINAKQFSRIIIHRRSEVTYPLRYTAELSKRGRELSDYITPQTRLVLDAGCSKGVETARIAAGNPGVYFLGLDIRLQNIMTAKSRRWDVRYDLGYFGDKWSGDDITEFFEFDGTHIELRRKLPNLGYIVGDFDHLPFGQDTFDLILAFNCSVYPHFRDESVESILRSLKPGSMVVTGIVELRKE